MSRSTWMDLRIHQGMSWCRGLIFRSIPCSDFFVIFILLRSPYLFQHEFRRSFPFPFFLLRSLLCVSLFLLLPPKFAERRCLLHDSTFATRKFSLRDFMAPFSGIMFHSVFVSLEHNLPQRSALKCWTLLFLALFRLYTIAYSATLQLSVFDLRIHILYQPVGWPLYVIYPMILTWIFE